MYFNKHTGRGLFALMAAVLAGFVVSVGGSSALSIRLPLAELGARSSAVVQGRVERVEAAWTADGLIESTVYLRPAKAPRGAPVEGGLIPIKVRGGVVDGVGMGVSEEPVFAPGEEVYVFLERPAEGAYRVVAGVQGKYDVLGGRAVNRETGLALSLAEMETGARENVWPAEPAATLDGASAAAAPENYVFNNAKWFGPNAMEEQYYINVNTGDANANGGAGAFVNAIVSAGNAWGNAGAAFSFKYGGTTGVTPVKGKSDGVNVIAWENMGNVSTLAEATWWYNDRGSVDQIVEVDIRFNDYYIWDATNSPAGNEQDLQSVATHEMGHWLSLGHDADAKAIMYYSYPSGSLKRALYSTDVSGVRAIYPAAATPVPPTATRTVTPSRTPTPLPTLAPWKIKGRVYVPMVLKR